MQEEEEEEEGGGGCDASQRWDGARGGGGRGIEPLLWQQRFYMACSCFAENPHMSRKRIRSVGFVKLFLVIDSSMIVLTDQLLCKSFFLNGGTI